MFSRRLSLSDLVALCRVLRQNLSAGVDLLKVLRQQAERGPRGVRPLAGRLVVAVQAGTGLGAALEQERDLLPPLFIALARLGDETGHLPEIFAELERYYALQQQLRRRFIGRSILPVAQFVLALLVFAVTVLIVGLLTPPGSRPLVSFFGLSGPAGAAAFLGSACAATAFVAMLIVMLPRPSGLLLRLPAIGPCLYALALGRFTMALGLTLDTGLTITRALRLSLDATGNPAFRDRADVVAKALKRGEPLTDALSAAGVFDDEFLHVVAAAEEAGLVPESMRQQAGHYQEEAARRLTLLTRLAGGVLWLAYAGFAIWMIGRIYGGYLRALGG